MLPEIFLLTTDSNGNIVINASFTSTEAESAEDMAVNFARENDIEDFTLYGRLDCRDSYGCSYCGS